MKSNGWATRVGEVGTASLLEIAWTLAALIGLIVTLANVSEGMRDLMLGLTGRGGPLVPVVAWNNVRNEIVLASVLTGFMMIGIVAMNTPNHAPSGDDVGQVLAATILIGLEILIVVNSFLNRRDRQVLKDPSVLIEIKQG